MTLNRSYTDDNKPLFGKANLEKQSGDNEYALIEGNVSIHFKLGGMPNMTETVQIPNGYMVTPFSSGSEFSDWDMHNCQSCKHNEKCNMYWRLTEALLDHGKIPLKTAKRIGYTRLTVQDNGGFVDLQGKCNEFESESETFEGEGQTEINFDQSL